MYNISGAGNKNAFLLSVQIASFIKDGLKFGENRGEIPFIDRNCYDFIFWLQE